MNEDESKIIEDLHKKLIENQEPLGEPFKNILYKNLWELYEN